MRNQKFAFIGVRLPLQTFKKLETISDTKGVMIAELSRQLIVSAINSDKKLYKKTESESPQSKGKARESKPDYNKDYQEYGTYQSKKRGGLGWTCKVCSQVVGSGTQFVKHLQKNH